MKQRKFGIAIVAASTLVLLACSQQALAKTGLVDMQKVFQSSAVQQLMKSGNADQKGIETAYKNYQQAQSAANKAKGAKKKALETTAKADQAKFQSLMAKQQAAARANQQRVVTTVKAAIARVSKAKGLTNTLVKQAVLYSVASQDVDITNNVIKALGKK